MNYASLATPVGVRIDIHPAVAGVQCLCWLRMSEAGGWAKPALREIWLFVSLNFKVK